MPELDAVKTEPPATIGAATSDPSPAKLQRIVPELRSTAPSVAPERKRPVLPENAGFVVAEKLPATFPVAASSVRLPDATSRAYTFPWYRTAVAPPPPEHEPLWCLASVAAAAGSWLAPDGAFKSVAVQLASTRV